MNGIAELVDQVADGLSQLRQLLDLSLIHI